MDVLNEAPALVGSCINCTTPASLLATLALIFVGIGLAHIFGVRPTALAGR